MKHGIVKQSTLSAVIISDLKLPLFLLIVILSSYIGLHVLSLYVDGIWAKMIGNVIPIITNIKTISMVIIVAWYLMRVITRTKDHFKGHTQAGNIYILSKLLQLFVIGATTLIIVEKLGLNISGIITFGGIGGIAAGLAAKDLLANFFGSLIVTLDRPFVVGDKIFSPDKQLSGVVTEIGWRLTKILSYEKRPIYIPNSLFATIIVQNDTRMTNRRINDFLKVRFDDIKIIDNITGAVKHMLVNNDDIDTKQTILACVDSIGSKIFVLHIYAFTKTVNWDKYKVVRQKILIAIAEIVNSFGANLVFPDSIIEVYEKELYNSLAQFDKT